jgi:hypothetical protein
MMHTCSFGLNAFRWHMTKGPCSIRVDPNNSGDQHANVGAVLAEKRGGVNHRSSYCNTCQHAARHLCKLAPSEIWH